MSSRLLILPSVVMAGVLFGLFPLGFIFDDLSASSSLVENLMSLMRGKWLDWVVLILWSLLSVTLLVRGFDVWSRTGKAALLGLAILAALLYLEKIGSGRYGVTLAFVGIVIFLPLGIFIRYGEGDEVIRGRVTRMLRRSGWRPGRDEPRIAEAFRVGRGRELFPQAECFLRKFGGIDVGGRLWIFSRYPADHFLLSFERRISNIVGSEVVPVASASYLSSTGVIWMDEQGRFYAADDDGMVFIAGSAAGFFRVVLLGAAGESAPAELRERLEQAYEWDAVGE